MINSNSINKLSEKIKSHYSTFSKTEKKIADYFLENSNSVVFLSIHEIAKRMNVGPSSIMRFSTKLEYSGFSSLKKDLGSFIQDDLAPLDKFKLHLNDPNSSPNTIEQIAQNEVNNINSLVNNFNEKQFQNIVKILLKAENVYTIGVGLSSHLANLTSYMLRRIGTKSFALNKLGITYSEQLMPIGKNDVLLAFSLPTYSIETIEAAKHFYENKSKIIGITNKITAPIIQYTTEHMLIKSDSKYIAGSLGAINVLIYTIVNEIAHRDKNRAMSAIEDIIAKRQWKTVSGFGNHSKSLAKNL